MPERFNLFASEQLDPQKQNQGYVQVYTGMGKGKSTAAMGVVLRALGRQKRVLVVMFTKGGYHYGELVTYQHLSAHAARCLTVVQAGLDRIVFRHNQKEDDNQLFVSGWQVARRAILSGVYDVIVLDEINIAIELGVIAIDDVLETLNHKPLALDVIMTGRNAHSLLINAADLVTDMQPVKHYWDMGVRARPGIEY